MRPIILDLLMPGAGLTWKGRLVLGLPLLVTALAALAALVLGRLLLVEARVGTATLMAGGLYLICGLVAAAAQVLARPPRPLAGDRLAEAHRRIAAAYLGERGEEALAGAQDLVRRAAGEPGAWRLLEVVARGQGRGEIAERAGRRALVLEREREDLAA